MEKDPVARFAQIRSHLSERKVRLYGVACCRCVGHLLEERSQQAVLLAERLADGQASEDERRAMLRVAGEVVRSYSGKGPAGVAACEAAASAAAWVVESG